MAGSFFINETCINDLSNVSGIDPGGLITDDNFILNATALDPDSQETILLFILQHRVMVEKLGYTGSSFYIDDTIQTLLTVLCRDNRLWCVGNDAIATYTTLKKLLPMYTLWV